MGYSTEFRGDLKFTIELTAKQIVKLKSMMGEDCRDHPDWEGSSGLYYIDLEINSQYDGIKWNGAEKTYDMVDLVNVVIREMRKTWPEFGLRGEMLAQGEDFDDRWALIVDPDKNGGLATKAKIAVVGTRCTCPDCGHVFLLEESQNG